MSDFLNARRKKWILTVFGITTTVISIWYAYSGNMLSADGNQLNRTQLNLSIRNDSVATTQKYVNEYGDILLMDKLLDEIKDIPLATKMINMRFVPQPDVNAVIELRQVLDKGIQSRIVLADSVIKPIWYDFHQKARLLEGRLKIYNAMGNPKDKTLPIRALTHEVSEDYVKFVDSVGYIKGPFK